MPPAAGYDLRAPDAGGDPFPFISLQMEPGRYNETTFQAGPAVPAVPQCLLCPLQQRSGKQLVRKFVWQVGAGPSPALILMRAHCCPALQALDRLLVLAREMGLRLILSLADATGALGTGKSGIEP